MDEAKMPEKNDRPGFQSQTVGAGPKELLRDAYNRGVQDGRDPLDELFRYHSPSDENRAKYQAINQAAKNFAQVVRANCPHCDDFLNTILLIRLARMMANAAVALKGQNI